MPTSATDAKDAAAIEAATEGVAVCDRSHWGRIRVSDDDRLRFLHNQSTNDFQSLKPGQGCDTVMVSSTARTIDLVSAYVLEDAVLLLTSPSRREALFQWLDRYIFYADKVQLQDITDETSTFSLIGAKSDAIVEKLGAGAIIGKPYGSHQQVGEVMVAVGSGLAEPGYTLILPNSEKAQLWQQILELGVVELSDRAWDMLRILQGRPAPDAELTDDYNPLEVGLWQTISFNKGCYIGQETIARLNTYKGVKQYLWGIRLNAPVEVGSAITVGDEKVGKLTSYTETANGHFGLGYIRSKAGGVGLKVQIGETEGEVVEIPFVSHQYPQ
ncbi:MULTISPECIES: YgfZ/GcvT domain-containing protein [Cyanophyceae]|uniref:Glycine cleavage system protein T n=1 Tax=Nodularia spumigena CENA596 TaxID=1819295 RepID=A0A166JUZ9_NODSP|nr:MULTISPECIES: folate-binding protein YgfZ [Cyanophyceae]KZL50167.1 glycine cleavage system protein T [Nodularia spumigena CENA596]MDB9337693.1 folate-binding protein YgfZ [Nodularia spumigena CS-589/07]MDB9400591.1 folate-binding protein YgfZ [Microcystis aeruginosa CS-567/02-A1]MDB9500179.1 folate-binding protein YgfZ [Nodularia spumigena CS-336/02]MDB9533454.1 folate-binding protein YgfZ [Nodularia spumigena CS-1038]